MQATAVNIVIVGLLTLLFGAVSRTRADGRAQFWVAGWSFVLTHFIILLWQPQRELWQNVQEVLSLGTLALAGLSFVLYNIFHLETRSVAYRLLAWLITANLTMIGLAVLAPSHTGVLVAVILMHHAFGYISCFKYLRNRPRTLLGISAVMAAGMAWMLASVYAGQPELVALGVLSEMFMATAADFWFDRPQQWGLGIATTCSGLLAWGLVFPVAVAFHHFWPHLAVNPEFWNIPKFAAAFGMILMSVEEDAQAAQKLTEEYHLLFDANPHPLWIYDVKTLELVAVNRAGLDTHGYTREEMMKLKLTDLIEPGSVAQVIQEVAAAKPSSNRASRHVRKDGSIIPMDVTTYDIVLHGRNCRFALTIDVTERERLNQQLVHQARHDVLTGLPNRILFQEKLHAAVEHALHSDEKVAVIYLDLRRFKHVNDIYGPHIADECLKQISALLNGMVRSSDLVARTGGDEFAILLCGLKSAGVAESISNAIMKVFTRPVQLRGFKIHISPSIGLVVCPDDGKDADTLWRGVESALYHAQEAGGGRIVWLSPELSSASVEQVELEEYMRTRMDDGIFHLAYQPLYNMEGTVVGMEALARLNHPRYGVVSPAKFIPIAEETGLILSIGEWVIEEVCRQIRIWDEQLMPAVPVAINVSGIQLHRQDFAERVLCILNNAGIDPRRIELEVTESVAMTDVEQVAKQMKALTAHGVRFSIDDFGTGHSSLGRLDQLPLSTLKIDRSFVERICSEDGTYSIVHAIITMAKSLGLAVIAEGVDSEEKIAKLRELECDYLQGFLLSRPLPPQEIPQLLEQTGRRLQERPALILMEPRNKRSA